MSKETESAEKYLKDKGYYQREDGIHSFKIDGISKLMTDFSNTENKELKDWLIKRLNILKESSLITKDHIEMIIEHLNKQL